MPADNLAYLLKYDSVYGTFAGEIITRSGSIEVLNKKIAVFQTEDPAMLPWKDLDIDVVLECTGRFTTKVARRKAYQAGAKRVLLSTTGAADIPLLIYGFNHNRLTPETNIISPGGCMTNCSITFYTFLIQLV